MFVVTQANLAFGFGIMGNLVSFFVTLSPLPTFYGIYKNKNAEGFQSIPYVISLFSAMLWIFYALFKKDDALLLITTSMFCVVMSTFYIVVYLIYAPKKAMMLTVKLVLLFIVFGFGAIAFVTLYFMKGETRVNVIGYICMIFSLCVFVAPLGIVRKVLKTKSVEYMPFFLSFFLTIGAVLWFFYGLLLKDMNIAIPNVLGFFLGVFQMILYAMYKNNKNNRKNLEKLQELAEHIVEVNNFGNKEVSALNVKHCIDGNEVKIHVQNVTEKKATQNKDGKSGVVVIEV